MDSYKKRANEAEEANKKLQTRINELVDKVIEKFEEKQGKILCISITFCNREKFVKSLPIHWHVASF